MICSRRFHRLRMIRNSLYLYSALLSGYHSDRLSGLESASYSPWPSPSQWRREVNISAVFRGKPRSSSLCLTSSRTTWSTGHPRIMVSTLSFSIAATHWAVVVFKDLLYPRDLPSLFLGVLAAETHHMFRATTEFSPTIRPNAYELIA